MMTGIHDPGTRFLVLSRVALHISRMFFRLFFHSESVSFVSSTNYDFSVSEYFFSKVFL